MRGMGDRRDAQGASGTLTPYVRLSLLGQTYVATVAVVAGIAMLAESEAWYVGLVVLTLPLSLLALWVAFYAGLAVGFVVGADASPARVAGRADLGRGVGDDGVGQRPPGARRSCVAAGPRSPWARRPRSSTRTTSGEPLRLVRLVGRSGSGRPRPLSTYAGPGRGPTLRSAASIRRAVKSAQRSRTSATVKKPAERISRSWRTIVSMIEGSCSPPSKTRQTASSQPPHGGSQSVSSSRPAVDGEGELLGRPRARPRAGATR